MAAENDHGRHQLNLAGIARDPRLEKQDPVPASSCRGGSNRIAGEHCLTGGILHVDDRRFAGDRDRFRQGPDFSAPR